MFYINSFLLRLPFTGRKQEEEKDEEREKGKERAGKNSRGNVQESTPWRLLISKCAGEKQ